MAQNSPGAIALFVAIVGAMLWIVWLGRRRSQFGGLSEVSASDQVWLAQAARGVYTDPQWRLCDPATPSAFDQHVLSLLDSIESNRDDIDARIEALRAYLRGSNPFERFKDKQKLSLVYSNVAAALVRGPMTTGMRQLFADWRMVGGIVARVSGAPKSWIRPLAGDAGATPPTTSGLVNRKVKLGRTATSIWAGFTFALTGAIIAAAFRSDATVVVEWFVGIFVGTLILFRTSLIRVR